ncbi:MAG TPA: DNA-binding protein YbiB [Casimicrobiaceae bacterium]|nr:DNA-binding protein YbiB [Casimicrobiaceae bacterium]
MIEAGRGGHDFAKWIRDIGRGPHAARPLATDAACELGSAMLAGTVPPLELGAILLAYRVKGETVAELTGFMAAIDRQLARLAPPAAATVRPVVLPTYNGARRLPNLTPLLALLLRRYGVPVLLHGMADDGNGFGRVTTAAVLWELGIDPVDSLAQAQRRLDRDGIAYVPMPLLSPALASLIELRQRMGVRSVAHTLAKLVDPFGGAGLRVVAVTHPDYVVRMREFLQATRANALLMRGTEGEPFAHPRRPSRIEGFDEGIATVLVEAEASASALPPALPDAIDAATTAAWISAALAGEVAIPQPILNQLACCVQRKK